MSEDPPEFYTKTLSPLSPLPVHPPEPANIPVLRNQIDPVFNMTSTHIESEMNDQATQNDAMPQVQPDSPSSDSSFGDAYKEQASTEAGKDVKASANASAGDDYAMTFDSDEEDRAQGQDVSQANADLSTESLASNVATNADTSPEITQESSLPKPQNAQGSTTSQPEPQSANTTTTEPIAETLLSPPAQTLQTDQSQTSTHDETASGGVDIQQLLDNITANAEKNDLAAQTASIPNPSLPAHSSLPPRPQIPLASPSNDTPTYPPQGLFPPASASYRPPGAPPTLVGAGAPGTSTAPMGGLPPPPGTSFSHPGPIEQMHIPLDHRDDTDNPEKRWGPEIQRLYDIFLEEERKNVTEGTWEKFPLGSRLFVGNLASEQVTKRDVFHIFHRYGRIAQISIKQAYGFVQYYSAEACQAALINQEGADLRGKKIHLEVSKPQKSHNQQRSSIGGQTDRNSQSDRNRQGRNNDRQDRNRGGRDDYGREQRQGRDDYRPRRSLTPPRMNDRNRDPYGTPRAGRDSYGRDRRERSPPPYDHRGPDNYRDRGFSPPRRDSYQDSDLQIPHRDPRDVPDIQLIVVEQLNRDFVSWCENEIRSRGVKTETMFLSPRLSLDAVIQRQVVEGVIAVSQLDSRAQNTSKISLRVFNRSAGVNNVRFDEYQGLDPKIAAELVLRDKQIQQAPQAPSPYVPPPQQYAQPSHLPYQQPHVPQAPVAATPNLAGLANLDNDTLQKLLGGLNSAQQQNIPAATQNSNIDLVGLLGMLNQQQATPQQPPPAQQPTYGALPPQQQQQYGGYVVQSPVNGTAYGAPQPNGQAQAQGNAQSVQNIMAALAKARQ